MNLFNGSVEKDRLSIVKKTMEIILEPPAISRLEGRAGEVMVGIRAEDIDVGTDDGHEAQIYSIENMGMTKIVTLAVNGLRFKASVEPKFDVTLDATLRFRFNQKKLYFFDQETGRNLCQPPMIENT